ncbi:MAG TPA: hypothetical protein VI818_08575, partial [Candidatus Thermoplasmatota archaeon]|nr:hypothetical protein [Candidatus Thermoplasmatota archaeon]
MARKRRPTDDGTSAVIGLLIGMTVFVGTFVYVVDVAVERQPSVEGPEFTRLSVTAKSLADILMEPGTGWERDPADTGCYSVPAAVEADGCQEYGDTADRYPDELCPWPADGLRLNGD